MNSPMTKEESFNKLEKMMEDLESKSFEMIDFAQSILRSDAELTDKEISLLSTILAQRVKLNESKSKHV